MKQIRPSDQTAKSGTSLLGKSILLCATVGGVGYVPIFPGTVGTLAAVPISFGLNRLAAVSLLLAGVTLVVAIFFAIYLSTRAAVLLQQKDPGAIVIDEVVGFLAANFAAPSTAAGLITTFLLFRFFDIAKVFPASRLERLPGGAGIVLDDVMAGIYTFAVMRLLLAWGMP